MNNSKYAAEQILEYLMKNGWIEGSDRLTIPDVVKSDIETIIIDAALINIDIINE